MPKTEAQTIAVRLPNEIVQDLIKMRNEKNLSTIGSALKFWMDQQVEEQRESELFELKKKIDGLNKLTTTLMTLTIKAHYKANMLFQIVDGQIRISDDKTGEKVEFSKIMELINKLTPEETWGLKKKT